MLIIKKIITSILAILCLAFIVNGIIDINQKHPKREHINHYDDVPVP